MKEMSRRSFLRAGTAATAALAMSPVDLLAKANSDLSLDVGEGKM